MKLSRLWRRRDGRAVTLQAVASPTPQTSAPAAPATSRLALADGHDVVSMVTASVPAPRAGDAAAERAAIRAWARQQGLQVSDKGRLPARVVEAYRAAH
jgi:hypothetical protein